MASTSGSRWTQAPKRLTGKAPCCSLDSHPDGEAGDAGAGTARLGPREVEHDVSVKGEEERLPDHG